MQKTQWDCFGTRTKVACALPVKYSPHKVTVVVVCMPVLLLPQGKQIKKVIFVPGKILNLIVPGK